ncbi:MAG: biotin--[acetyl-CoA-carboxylase] ligase [Neisseriaceae bacterium]|nr:biotin--[acetyl-CoA-carboxylase] ligase [Neisseriaceae bacterium]
MLEQLFPEHIQVTSDSIELLIPIALFTSNDFIEFSSKHLLQVEVINTCLSTNSVLINRIKEGQQGVAHQVLVTNEQLEGRGRQEHHWQSVVGHSLIFSLAWEVQLTQEIQTIPLVIAVAIGRALQHFNVEIQIKWPNDIVIAYQKLAGILVESIRYQSHKMLVIGIGMNFNSGYVKNADNISLNQLNPDINPTQLLSVLLDEIEQALITYLENGFESFQKEFNQWHRDVGKMVRLTFKQETILEGIVQEIASNGALVIVDLEGKKHDVTTSDFSLRVLDT